MTFKAISGIASVRGGRGLHKILRFLIGIKCNKICSSPNLESIYKCAYNSILVYVWGEGAYGIDSSCTDKITFSVLYHKRETKARLVHAFYLSSSEQIGSYN